MDLLLELVGWAALLFVAVPLSIGLHEIGHLVPAKRFGVRCSQYMVGFGPTVWSRRVGETEYGIKAIPLGGYVRMIGMYPPRRADRPLPDEPGRWGVLIEEARYDARSDIRPEDEGRQFYQRTVLQRVIVMLGGPAMNLLIAVVVFTGLLTLYGVGQASTQIGTISACVLPASAPASATCAASDPVSPASKAGLRVGDRIEEIDGRAVTTWSEIETAIRSHPGTPVALTVRRDGADVRLTLTPVRAQRPVLTADGEEAVDASGTVRTQSVGFAGLSTTYETVRQPLSAVPGTIWSGLTQTVGVIWNIPAKTVGVVKAILGVAPRDPSSPMSLIGVGRVAGQVTSESGLGIGDRIAALLELLGALNLALFVFNLVPLLPLDGGHVAGALWEGLRRAGARLLRRPDPGPVDTARALPLVYAGASLLLVMGGLLIVADLVSPVKLSG